MAVVRGIWPVDAIAIALPRPELRHIPVPHLIRAFGQGQAETLMGTLRGIEETEVDARCMCGEQGKIHPRAIPRGAKGIRIARPDVHRSALLTARAAGAGHAESPALV